MKTFKVTYEKNGVYQSIMIEAKNEDDAKGYFDAYKPKSKFIGIVELASVEVETARKKGMPLFKL